MIKANKPLNGQIQHELTSWLRLIEFLRQENALLKYRLSELVDNSDDPNFLQIAEYFQNEFLIKDEALKKLIKDLRDYSDIIQKQEQVLTHPLITHNKLRKEISQFQEKYSSLSTEFNKKMLQNN